MFATNVTVMAALGMVAISGGSAGAASQREIVEGTVRLLATDTVNHQGTGSLEDTYRQVLIIGERSYFLKGRAARPNTRVRVVGAVDGNVVQADEVEELGEVASAMPPSGTTKVLVMLAHWSAPDAVTPESAHAQMFTDSNGWYRDASYGALGQSGDVTPWMRIDGPADGRCYGDGSSTMAQAKAAATALGYQLTDYANFVLYSPWNGWQVGSDCNGFAGWAYVGAPGTWLNGYMDRRVTVHEQGHNYGLLHAHSYLCADGLGGTCEFSEYGDPFDAMGGSGLVGHFSGSQKALLGWMEGRIVDLSGGGRVTLAPLAQDRMAPSAAVVSVSAERSYWLEYRQPVDYDGSLPASGTDGVQVRLQSGTTADGGVSLIDARPADGISVDSATIRPGGSWTTPEGFTFSVSRADGEGAAVVVSAPTCADAGFEPDDTAAQARRIRIGVTEPHAFCTLGDQDWIAFNAVGGTTYRFDTLNLTAGTDTMLDVYSSDGATVLAHNDDHMGLASLIDFTPPTSGAYLLRAVPYNPSAFSVGHRFDLRTGIIDVAAPQVLARMPAPEVTTVQRSASVRVTFNETVADVSTTTFVLSDAASGVAVPAGVYPSGPMRQWTLDPSQNLAAATRYTVTLTGGPAAIRDTAGNPLQTTSWSITTGR